jgi:peptidoglycan/LPS O-acetylase OafA/YrhL
LFSLLLISIASYTFVFVHPLSILFERLYFSVLFALIIGVLCFSQYVPKLEFFFKPFDYLGKIALGLYFYHGIVITVFSKLMIAYHIADDAWQVLLINPIIMMLLTILLASISYNYFEKPILALKRKFYRHNSTAHT